MPKITSFLDTPGDSVDFDARIVWIKKKEWRIEVGKDQVDLEYGGREGLFAPSLEFVVRGFDCTLDLKLGVFSFSGAFRDGTEVWYRRSTEFNDMDCLIPLGRGGLAVGDALYSWRPVPHKRELQVLDQNGEVVLTAYKPWQDSLAHILWQIKWENMPEDFRDRIAILVAPWYEDFVAVDRKSKF